MPITNQGIIYVTQQIVVPGISFNSTNAYLGVGDSSTAFDPTQTDLQATTNKERKPMDPGFPAVSGDQITLQATFGLTDANYNWLEWAVFNALTAGTMLVRKVETIGSGAKTNTQIWTLSVTLTLSAT